MKKVFIGLGVLIVLSGMLAFLNSSKGSSNSKKEDKKQVDIGTRVRPSDDARRLSQKTGVPFSLMNECVVDVLLAYETGSKELIHQKVFEWLEKDEKLLLGSIEAFDNLINIFGWGLEFPANEVGLKLYEKHGGEKTMELMSKLSTISNTAKMLTIGSIRAWGTDQLEHALGYIGENPNFDFTNAAVYLTEDQAQSEVGSPEQIVQFFAELPDDDPRRQQGLDLAYDRWVDKDPAGFADYVNTLDDLTPVAGVLPIYAGHASELDMNAALEWVEVIPDKDMRNAALESIAAQMAYKEPEAYQAWLKNHSFESEIERARFVEAIDEAVKYEKNRQPSSDENFADIFNQGIELGPEYDSNQ